MRIAAAAIQMKSEPHQVAANCERADAHLRTAHQAGAELVVLPEMFNTGYGWFPDYGPMAESHDGPTIRFLRERSQKLGLTIAAGFVEEDRHHLYDSIGFFTPDGRVHIYRKRNLVFWERFRFLPGRKPLVVPTPFGRVGFAICADMIFRKVWEDYRNRIDLAIVSAAWPEFTRQHTGRKHWLFGHIGHLSGSIPSRVAQDLGVPVVFSNQSGPTRTTIPLLGSLIMENIPDRFAGLSSISDGLHGSTVRAGVEDEVIVSNITIHSPKGPKSCHSMFPSAHADTFSGSVPSSSVSPAFGSTDVIDAAAF
jgi:predicted amidohydrolase